MNKCKAQSKWIGKTCWIIFVIFLLNLASCLSGYRHLLHVILPAKIQGLGKVKLDRPLNRKIAVREGDYYKISVTNAIPFVWNPPFDSMIVKVMNKGGKDYATSIHTKSRRDCYKLISLFEEKYGEPVKTKEGNYYFYDWRSWNFIKVTPGVEFEYVPDNENDNYISLNDFFNPRKKKVAIHRIDVCGQLHHESDRDPSYEEVDMEEVKRWLDLNSL